MKQHVSDVGLYCVCLHCVNQTCFSHLIISTTHCPVKSTRAIMKGGKKETHRTSTSYQLDTVGVLFCSQTTAHICLSESHKHLNTHPPPNTHSLFVSKSGFWLQQPHMICQQERKKGDCGKMGLVCEAESMHLGWLWTLTMSNAAIQKWRWRRDK